MNLFTSKVGSLLRMNTGQRVLQRSGHTPDVQLTLYEYEASPWCRLVREHLHLLNLTCLIKPTPRQTLLAEGAFDDRAAFRKESWDLYQEKRKAHTTEGNREAGDAEEQEIDRTYQFPMLLDHTVATSPPVLVTESGTIVSHLWQHYSESVVEDRPKVDLLLNSDGLPFFLRFPLLSAPSGLRPFPNCGLLQNHQSTFDGAKHEPLTLTNLEGCPVARLVREKLSSLCIPYYNVPGGEVGKVHLMDPNCDVVCHSGREAMEHLDQYVGQGEGTMGKGGGGGGGLFNLKSLWHRVPPEKNLGRVGGNFVVAASGAMRKGKEYFVHPSIGQCHTVGRE